MSSRPWMVAFLALLGYACGFVCACSGDRPQVGGETHWLRACDADDPCGGGLQCICGSCTRACSSDAACGGGRPAACYDMGSPLLLQRCERSALEQSAGVCLPSCASGAQCASAQSCLESACVPGDPIGQDAGAVIGVDAGPVLGGYAGEIGAQGTTIDDFTDVSVPMSWSDEIQLPVLSATIEGRDAAQLVGVWTTRDCDRSPTTQLPPQGSLTNCPRIAIEVDARGVVSGTLQFLARSSRAPLPPVVDPDVGYPPGLSARETQELASGATGIPYPLRDGRFEAGVLQFTWSPKDLYREWCGAQTPHRWSVDDHTFYFCAPQDPAAQAELDPIKVMLCVDASLGPRCPTPDGEQPCACIVAPGSAEPELAPAECNIPVCHCERDRCDADTRSFAAYGTFAVDGDAMVGAWTSPYSDLESRELTFVREVL